MDFPNERYVRLYVRDTVTWLRLEWDGQNCLSQLLRKADRAGVIDLSGMQPWEAAVVLCRAPEDAAKRGVAKMLELGCAVHDGDRLVFPRYIEANECAMSDKQRAKESRAKRAVLSQNVTAPSLNVTESHGASHDVTVSHTPSHAVTPRHSVPCRAVLNQAVPCTEPAPAREEQGSDHWLDGSLEETIRLSFQKRYETATKAIPNQSQLTKMSAGVTRWVSEVGRLRDLEEGAVLRKLLDGFFASDSAREKGFPPAFLLANPLEYYEQRKPKLEEVKAAQSSAALGGVLKEIQAARERARKADPDSWERTQAENELAELQQRASKLKAAAGA